MISKELLTEAKNRLVEKFHPERVILFGSQARGTAGKHSDVDILVVGSFSKKRTELMTDMHRSLQGLRFPCDIIVLTSEEFESDRHIPGTIARPAWKEGVVLYDR